MTKEEAQAELDVAMAALARYREKVGCGWCSLKGGDLNRAVQELHRVTPLAHDFSDAVDNLRADNIQTMIDDIRTGGGPAMPPPVVPALQTAPEAPLEPDPVPDPPGRVGREGPPRLFGGGARRPRREIRRIRSRRD